MELIWAIPLGLFTGGLLGALGAGGSVLTVPALVYLLDQPVGPATTASLAIVSANAAVGAAANWRAGTIDVPLASGFGVASIGGALVGARLNRLADGQTILFLLALLMLGSAWSLWRGRPEGRGDRNLGRGARIALIAGLGVVVGVLTGFFGVGGGFLIVPVLILLLDVPLRRAIGTSLLIIAITGLAGLLGHLAEGSVDWSLTLVFGAAGMVGAWAGGLAGQRVSGQRLQRLFALMLVAVSAVLLARNGSTFGL